MRSLRSRLGLLMASGVLVITVVASVAIIFERWQEENSSLVNNVELAAFQLSESRSPTASTQLSTGGVDSFAVIFDGDSSVLGQQGDVSAALLDDLINDVWTETTEQNTAVTFEYGEDPRVVVSGVACVEQLACDSVVVGAAEEPFLDFLASRWARAFAPGVIAALMAWSASRWLVGRSLRPVDEMRRELESITATDLERRVTTPTSGDELERLGLTLNETITRLGSAVSANERFVADAAHELRSPITGVRAALEVEASRNPDSIVADSVGELDRASRLIDDLLLLARRQGEPAAFHDVDIDDIVRQEVAALGARFPDIGIEQAIDPIRISGVADALRQVVKNMLENAGRYGGRQIAVTLRGDVERCTLLVEDDGPGIPEQDRDRIFERFARLDASRSRHTGGSGLGLAIVKEIIADHHGTIAVGDSILGGARFEVRLPLAGQARANPN